MNDWTIIDHTRDRELYADSRSEGEEKLEEFEGQLKLELLDPKGNTACVNWEDNKKPRVETEDSEEAKADGGTTVEPEVVDQSEEETVVSPNGHPVPADANEEEPTQEEMENDPDIITSTEDLEQSRDQLPDRSVSDDPLQWVPGEFVDTIDGTQAINRKGFAVLGHFYKVETESEVIVPPEDTDFEFCRVKAVATTKDGRRYEAHGSSHTDRGDDSFLLLEMADTRAKKRALADATGVGAVAVEELKNEVMG